MNRPMKNTRVPHSTSSRKSDGPSPDQATSAPAPSRATIAGSRCSIEWKTKATSTRPSTTKDLISSGRFWIASRSSRFITFWAACGS